AAGACISDRKGLSSVGKELQRSFDDELRFGSRDENRWRDLKRQSPEFPLPGDIRGRFARGSARDEAMILFGKPYRLGLIRRHEILRRVPSKHMLGEYPRAQFSLSGADTSVSQHLTRVRDAFVNSGHQPSGYGGRVFEFFRLEVRSHGVQQLGEVTVEHFNQP